MTTKGWTQNEAERRASWLHTAYPHSKMTARAVFDTVWDEWVVMVEYPGAPTTIDRKPRRGPITPFATGSLPSSSPSRARPE